MSIKQHLNDILDANNGISFEDAHKLIKDKYKQNLTRSNFDKIKHDRRGKIKGKKGKKSPSKKKSPGNANFISPSGSSPLLSTSLSTDQITNMSWENLLKLAIFKQVDIDIQALVFYEKQGWFKRDVEKDTQERYIFQVPSWFYPHQHEVFNYMMKGSCIVWGMRQLTAKTTTALVASFAKMYSNDHLVIIHISPSEKLSIQLLGKTSMDPLLFGIYKEQAHTMLRESVELINGSKLIVRPCKISSVQGLTGGVWIDELDKILLEQEKTAAFCALLPVVIKPLIEGKAFIWITCNQATGAAALAFEYFKSIIMKFGSMFRVIEIKEPDGKIRRERYCEVLNEFDPKIPVDPFAREQWYIDFIYELQRALMGEEFALAQMKNIFLDISGIWTKADLLLAFQSFDESKIPNWDHVEYSVQGFDPGAVHGTGIVIVLKDMDTKHLWVVVAEKMYGTQASESEILGRLISLYEDWNCDISVGESNSGGWLWIKDLSDKGYNYTSANFGTSNEATGMPSSAEKTIERQWKEKVLKYYLENQMIHIVKSEELLREFSLYNPYENKEKGKGDIVDAALHAIFECAGGVEFALTIGEGQDEREKEESDKVAYSI